MGKLGRIRKLDSKVATRLRSRDVAAPEAEPQATPSTVLVVERPDTAEHLIAFAEEHGAVWESPLVQDRPDQLCEVLEMVCQNIPQIGLLDAEGEVAYRCEPVLDEAGFGRLTMALEGVIR